jgi:hypothetical protein
VVRVVRSFFIFLLFGWIARVLAGLSRVLAVCAGAGLRCCCLRRFASVPSAGISNGVAIVVPPPTLVRLRSGAYDFHLRFYSLYFPSYLSSSVFLLLPSLRLHATDHHPRTHIPELELDGPETNRNGA